MRPNVVELLPFASDTLTKLLVNRSSKAVKYLHGYLSALHAQSILIESHYIDRHYLDEFSHYYSRSFQAPPPFCARILAGIVDKVEADADMGLLGGDDGEDFGGEDDAVDAGEDFDDYADAAE